MRILITNDDGIEAPALPILASTLARAGHDVVVAAPLEVHSGCGASIGQVTENQVIALKEVTLSGASELPTFAVDAPPAFIVLAAVQGLFGKRPDVVITGPNSGLNLGPLVLHSGTLGAAITAAQNEIPGIALSTTKRARHGFETAAEFCVRHLEEMIRHMGADCALNINVPDLPLENIAGTRLTKFARASLVAILISDAASGSDATEKQRQMAVSIDYTGGEAQHRKWRAERESPDESDAGAILDGCISVTVVHAGLHYIADRAMPFFAG